MNQHHYINALQIALIIFTCGTHITVGETSMGVIGFGVGCSSTLSQTDLKEIFLILRYLQTNTLADVKEIIARASKVSHQGKI